MEPDEYFSGHYDQWRNARYNKIVALLGADFFRGQSLLELGCGFGDFGMMFVNLGADVTFADGREDHLLVFRTSHGGHDSLVIDQDTKWDLDRQFNYVLHSGVLYHLQNWQQDLTQAIKHTKTLMILETEVANSNDDSYEYKNKETGYDQALNGVGIRPSAAYIEKHLRSLGATFQRYDDADLNTQYHRYDWVVDEQEKPFAGSYCRRFWLVFPQPK